MPYPSFTSLFLLWANSNASFVRLDTPGNYLQLGFFVFVLIVVTAFLTSFYRRVMFQRALYNSVGNLLARGLGGSAAVSHQGATARPQKTFTRKNWMVYALLSAGVFIWFSQSSVQKSNQGQRHSQRLASFEDNIPNTIQNQNTTLAFADDNPSGQFYNQSPLRSAKPTYTSAPDQPQNKPMYTQQAVFTTSRQVEPALTDAQEKFPNETTVPQQLYTVQISAGSVEEFAMAKAKDVAGLKPGHRVYLYPNDNKIKVVLGTFTDREAANTALSRYRGLSGKQGGFVATLPAEAEGNLFIVPG